MPLRLGHSLGNSPAAAGTSRRAPGTPGRAWPASCRPQPSKTGRQDGAGGEVADVRGTSLAELSGAKACAEYMLGAVVKDISLAELMVEVLDGTKKEWG